MPCKYLVLDLNRELANCNTHMHTYTLLFPLLNIKEMGTREIEKDKCEKDIEKTKSNGRRAEETTRDIKKRSNKEQKERKI